MNAVARAVCIVFVTLVCSAGTARGAESYHLAQLAREDGFVYSWLPSDAAAVLSRPGISVLVSAGNPRYEVNGEPHQLASAPRYVDGDLVVGAPLQRELAQLAAAHPLAAPSPLSPPVAAAAPAAPAAITAQARPLEGAAALEVSGTGPAGATLDVVLSAQLSRELPTVVLQHVRAVANADGTYVVDLPTAQLTFERSVLVATVSAPGAVTARIVIPLTDPNPHVDTPADRMPNN